MLRLIKPGQELELNNEGFVRTEKGDAILPVSSSTKKKTITEKYNGWTNYETWLANLWMGEWGMSDISFFAGDDLENLSPRDQREWQDVRKVADAVKSYFEDMIDDTLRRQRAGFIQDILNNALTEINWREIADHLI